MAKYKTITRPAMTKEGEIFECGHSLMLKNEGETTVTLDNGRWTIHPNGVQTIASPLDGQTEYQHDVTFTGNGTKRLEIMVQVLKKEVC